MGEGTMFFLPGAIAETQEGAYAELAQHCRCPLPDVNRRIYSLSYSHNGEQWVATVGEFLMGHAVRFRGKKSEHTEELTDSARVIAIFAGDVAAYAAAPYMVLTDGGASMGRPSRWENPFMAGRSVAFPAYFASGEAA